MLKTAAIILSLVFASANGAMRAQSEKLPTTNGNDAVKRLKQTGEYDSLKQAFKDARLKNFQDEENTQDFFGQSSKLVSPFPSNIANFGYSIAISGNYLVVGENGADIGMNNDQGAAYVFVRSGNVWTYQARLLASNGGADDGFGASVSISGDTIVVGTNEASTAFNGSVYVFTRSGTNWTQQAELIPAGGGEKYGEHVAVSGDTVAVSARLADGAQGAVYVFTRSGNTWTQQTRLVANDGAPDDRFGSSLSIEGDNLIVGAMQDAVGMNSFQGSAYIFVRNAGVWTQQAKLTASDGAMGDFFGCSAAISGNTVVVGACEDEVGINSGQGSAYIFTRSGTNWTEQAKLTASDGAIGDSFGSSASISGDTVVVGVEFDNAFAIQDGSAYVFTRSGNAWTERQKLTAEDGQEGNNFGVSVAVSGNEVFVGAWRAGAVNINPGAVYMFRVLSPNWTEEANMTSADGAASDFFGSSVAINGDTAVVGASFDDVGMNANQGSAYVFIKNGSTWTQQAQLTASDGAAGDQFGASVAIHGQFIVVGAVGDDVGMNTDQGSAYVFRRSGSSWIQESQLLPANGAPFDSFGCSVGVHGDRAIVGAYLNDVSGNSNQGSVHVFLREFDSVAGLYVWNVEQRLLAADGEADDFFGISAAIFDDNIVVGAHLDDVGSNTDQGSVYAFRHFGTGWTQTARLFAGDGETGDRFGESVAISRETILVGAERNDIGPDTDQGTAYVFVGDGTNWTQEQRLLATNGAAGDNFGNSVAISGDIAVVGAFWDDIEMNGEQGSAYVFERMGTTWTQRQRLSNAAGASNDQFGSSVAVSGDKILVGAPFVDTTPLSNFGKNTGGDSIIPSAIDQGAALFFVNQPLPPTAATVSIGGRVLTSGGGGLQNARIYLTGASGETRMALTNAFGYYRFNDVNAGQTVVITVASKRYQFVPQIVSVSEEINELNFSPEK